MTSVDLNPKHWSDGVYQMLTLLATVLGAVWYLGSQLYSIGAAQAVMQDHLVQVRDGVHLVNTKIDTGLEREIAARNSDIRDVRDEVKAIRDADIKSVKDELKQVELDAARVDTTLGEIKSITTDSRNIVRSHDPDIKAIRSVVAPKAVDR